MFNWNNTKVALQNLQEVLKCKTCMKIPDNPVNYNMCGHFFCKLCVRGDRNACPVCGVPSLASEITTDRLIANLIMGWRKICSTVGFESSIDSLGSEDVLQYDELRDKELEVKSSRHSSSDSDNKRVSKRRSNKVSTKRASLTETEPVRKKTRNSRSKGSCTPDTQKSSTTIVRKSRTSQNSASKNINKRNAKGETQLHVACIKGKVDQVNTLLEEGANPNTKDHAGWTPLLESVNHGYVDISELLLKNGTMVNVPGCDNITPLHEAVLNNKLEVVKLLIMYGADADAHDVNGMTPKDFAKTEDMKNALYPKTKAVILKPTVEIQSPSLKPGHAVLFGCGLDKHQHEQLTILTRQLKLKLLHSYSTEITHIVVQTNASNVCSANRNIIQGILQGKWIVNCNWLDASLEVGEVIDPQPFEVKGTTNFPNSDAPKNGRLNAEKQLPGILNGCHFYLSGIGTTYTLGNNKLTKLDMVTLIQSANGMVLSREPDPESIPSEESTVPYHAPRNSSLSKCSHFIIYKTGKDEPKLKYNMTHIKSLSVQWLFDCMESFNIREPLC